ncbi:hypothetical protein I3842_12G014900 [Carya illinoinensis]|uniref:Uncharacterized protein n=2 Tax=Carya illinoinensis TaxID=32201 RepID=A0A922DFI1_CARIL|nr:hypothetical protein I3842_12G014900 [Carya illinoinensis]
MHPQFLLVKDSQWDSIFYTLRSLEWDPQCPPPPRGVINMRHIIPPTLYFVLVPNVSRAHAEHMYLVLSSPGVSHVYEIERQSSSIRFSFIALQS